MASDYFDYLLDSVPSVEPTDWSEITTFLEQSQAQQQDQLERELVEIDQQLAHRDRIHRDVIEDLEGKIERYTNRLEHLYTIGKGRTDGTREQVKDRLVSFYQELHDEHRAHWRDRQELERERRTVFRELAEVTDDSLSEFLQGD